MFYPGQYVMNKRLMRCAIVALYYIASVEIGHVIQTQRVFCPRNSVADLVDHYNTRRLHRAIAYITPKNKLDGRAETILTERDAKLAAAREARKAKRRAS